MITFHDHSTGKATLHCHETLQKPDGTYEMTVDLTTRIEKDSKGRELLSDHIDADVPGAVLAHQRARDRIASTKTKVKFYESDVLVSFRMGDEKGDVIMDTKSGKVMGLDYAASEKRETFSARLRIFNITYEEFCAMGLAFDRQVFVKSKLQQPNLVEGGDPKGQGAQV